jgi:hypothetical protein
VLWFSAGPIMRFPVNSSFMGRGPFVAIYHKKDWFFKGYKQTKSQVVQTWL